MSKSVKLLSLIQCNLNFPAVREVRLIGGHTTDGSRPQTPTQFRQDIFEVVTRV